MEEKDKKCLCWTLVTLLVIAILVGIPVAVTVSIKHSSSTTSYDRRVLLDVKVRLYARVLIPLHSDVIEGTVCDHRVCASKNAEFVL